MLQENNIGFGDSGSGSSSDTESDGVKASVPKVTAEETTGSGANSEQKEEIVVPDAENRESAPSERQVSPEKLYRAALLRSRFADTILKAQEKTLGKIEKQDAERLKLEREEIERRRKEEKARLQAEAKAAEEARRKAEAEAAAEAKRKRELEREAARQALQLMEKTVDINENCQFMEDLDMLRAAPAEQLESFIEEASPDCNSQDGLGSFKFQGSNPLEQLGLYMKADDEEDEVEPESGPAVNCTNGNTSEQALANCMLPSMLHLFCNKIRSAPEYVSPWTMPATVQTTHDITALTPLTTKLILKHPFIRHPKRFSPIDKRLVVGILTGVAQNAVIKVILVIIIFTIHDWPPYHPVSIVQHYAAAITAQQFNMHERN
ncbi:hypothetical protein RJ639_002545 [Escallonia herrerae]|uniref:Uncharacterized protein n=1 Tax=Escallonia herrerae TaxID=1293975 RepID=A0AA88XB39_9ASTE|nr:hypothetical protein RJ639_002545 [Escallonia herrerae]